MRPRTAFALATLATTALLTGVVGSAGGPGSVVDRLTGPAPASAAELPAFHGCDELLDWYITAALPHVGPWGLTPGWYYGPAALNAGGRDVSEQDLPGQDLPGQDLPGRAASPGLAQDTSAALANSATGTNVQEVGVDEPDVVKTDGRFVAHLRGHRLVLTDTAGPAPARAGELALPREMAGAEMLWVGDRLVLVGDGFGDWVTPGPPGRTALPGEPGMPGPIVDVAMPAVGTATRVVVVDASDPGTPTIEQDVTYDGSLVEARQHDTVVRLVLATTTPAIDFVQPRRGRTAREATQENRRLVRESSIEAWLPAVHEDGARTALVACTDVRHPEGSPDGAGRGPEAGNASSRSAIWDGPWAGSADYGTVSVVAFDPAEAATRRTAAVTTGNQLVYSSSERLYLALPRRGGTDVHAFALDGTATEYVASGTAPGSVRDRWSMDEHEGRLRVATALGSQSWNPRENAVVVLEERDGTMVEVGRADRMGIRERIQSVRWFGDVAVVVTFRQVDPLYTLDLSDPTAPVVRGELKIPGFSSYLHPVGDGLLLGLGQDASLRGRTRGAQASLFDITDLAAPRRVATEDFGGAAEFTAAWDPRGFTYLPQRRTALAALDDWRRGSRLVALVVGTDGLLRSSTAEVPLPRWGGTVRALPLDDGRIAVHAGDRIRLLDLSR